MTKPRQSAVKGFDMTIFENHNEFGLEKDEVLSKLNSLASQWVAQREIAPTTGRPHWQIRLKAHKRMLESQFVSLASSEGLCGHITITSTTAHVSKTFSYVMKADTRDPEHPTVHSDREYEPPQPKLSHIVAFEEMEKYPWQQEVIEMAEVYDERAVDVIIDPSGNNGKTYLQDWMHYEGLAWKVPNFTEQTEMIEFVFSFPARNCYLINMPKAQKKAKLAGFYAGVETLKDGYLYDKRYKGRMKHIEKPRVFVFTNQIPDVGLLSADRWRLWRLRSSTKELENITDIVIPHISQEDADTKLDRELENMRKYNALRNQL